MNHPVRRRIVMLLMLLGNAGLITAASSLILTFVRSGSGTSLGIKVVLLMTGLAGLWALASSPWVDRHLSRCIDRALRRVSSLGVTDYESLMHLGGEYRLAELQVQPDDWLAERTLAETRLRDEGVVVLGLRRPGGTFLGAPTGDSRILPSDTLVLYGRGETICDLDQRRESARAERRHEEAVERQREIEREERTRDPGESVTPKREDRAR